MPYRPLSPCEIEQLKNQGCQCQHWELIEVSHDFIPQHLHHVTFSRNIKLHRIEGSHILPGGIEKPAGIYHAHLDQCEVGPNVLIQHITHAISQYHIGERAVIIGVGEMYTTFDASFGQGVQAHVLNETGGREITFYSELSAEIAYLLAMYRHRPQAIKQLESFIHHKIDLQSKSMGQIGKGAQILHCPSLKNVHVGEYAQVKHGCILENGSILSSKTAPTRVEHHVIARDFIIAQGAVVNDGATLKRSFVGQATHIGSQFTAHDSVFFSNCQMENGEACAVFAGPYSVSMHKSTLLIGGLISFFNAGSGSNQSNHMYKLGPSHQGILERGVRLASDSYIMWPARVGAFSMVMGRHSKNLDTSKLPFSYLLSVDNGSLIVPGITLLGVGTKRDTLKWPNRDRRQDAAILLDRINFDWVNPAILEQVRHGISELEQLQKTEIGPDQCYTWQGAKIKSTSIPKGILYYTQLLESFIGEQVSKRLLAKETLESNGEQGLGRWCDLAGMLAPRISIDSLLDQLENRQISSLAQVESYLQQQHDLYPTYVWQYTTDLIEQYYGFRISSCTKAQLHSLLQKGEEAHLFFLQHMIKDAAKEFEGKTQTSFGIDHPEQQIQDFHQVRGNHKNHPFILQLQEECLHTKQRYQELYARVAD